MDRKERDRRDRLNKLYYLREEPFRICANILRGFGYQDIEIDIPIYENNIGSDTYNAELRKMTVDFRYKDYRYHLEAQCCDGDASPDNIYRIFTHVLKCIKNPNAMCTANIGEEFQNYWEEHGFRVYSHEGENNFDSANLIAFREEISYRMILYRIYELEIKTSPCENSQHIKFDPEKHTLFLNQIQKSALAYKMWYKVQGNQHIELSDDLSQLDITLVHGWSRSSLSIRTEPLYLEISEEVFRHLVLSWMYSKGRDKLFSDDIIFWGHIPQNFTDNRNSFEVLYHGMKYSIITKNTELVDFDNLDGHAFEQFCAEILAHNGFSKVRVTQGSRDQGIDIIAYKDDIRFGFQCKCYATDIGNKAVQEVYAGKEYYNCDVAVVLTNRYFTKSAVELAQRNRVHLWDRRKLSELIENCKEQLLETYKK